MRTACPEKLETGRVTYGQFGTRKGEGMYGAFFVQGPCGSRLKIIASDGQDQYGWEHVSVSTERRCPNWQEMSFVKDLFWTDDECVIQFHPPKSEYVNNHPFCLHLWRPNFAEIPMPPSIMVGHKGMSVEEAKAAARLSNAAHGK